MREVMLSHTFEKQPALEHYAQAFTKINDYHQFFQ